MKLFTGFLFAFVFLFLSANAHPVYASCYLIRSVSAPLGEEMVGDIRRFTYTKSRYENQGEGFELGADYQRLDGMALLLSAVKLSLYSLVRWSLDSLLRSVQD